MASKSKLATNKIILAEHVRDKKDRKYIIFKGYDMSDKITFKKLYKFLVAYDLVDYTVSCDFSDLKYEWTSDCEPLDNPENFLLDIEDFVYFKDSYFYKSILNILQSTEDIKEEDLKEIENIITDFKKVSKEDVLTHIEELEIEDACNDEDMCDDEDEDNFFDYPEKSNMYIIDDYQEEVDNISYPDRINSCIDKIFKILFKYDIVDIEYVLHSTIVYYTDIDFTKLPKVFILDSILDSGLALSDTDWAWT